MKKLLLLLALMFPVAAACQPATPQYLPCTGSGATKVCTTAGTLSAAAMHTTNLASSQPALLTLQSCLANATTQICPIAIIGDSIQCCIGPTNITNGPAFQLIQHFQNSGYPMRGTGLYTVNANPAAPKAGWKALQPSLSGVGQTTELGSTQTGTGAFGAVWTAATIGSVLQGYALVNNTVQVAAGVSFAGNQLIVEGMTDASTTACTVTIDPTINFGTGTYTGGTVLTTSLGGTSGSPAAYYQTYTIAGSSSSTVHTALVTPTNTAAGQCDLYAMGYNQNAAGVEIDNFATGFARSEAFGSNVATQLAFVAAMPVKPVAAIISLGVNDMINGTGVTQSQYQTRMQNIAAQLRTINPQMSLIFLDEENVSSAAPVLTKTQVTATELSLALNYLGEYVSVAEAWGTEANAALLGLMISDGTHPSDAGGRSLGTIEYNALTSSQVPLPVNPTASSSQLVQIPSFYSASVATTASGTTVTFVSSTPIFFDTSATINVTNCTNATFQATAPTIVSVSGFTVVMTYATAPSGGTSTINCAINSSEVILNGAYGVGFNVGAPTFQSYTSVVFNNIVAGVNYLVTMNGNGTFSNVWPAAFINAPALPASAGLAVSYSAVLTSATTAAFPLPNVWRLGASAAFTASIAANTCAFQNASVTSGMQALGYRISTSNVFTATPQTNPGNNLIWSAYYSNSLTVIVKLCNITTSAVTPTSAVFNVTVQ